MQSRFFGLLITLVMVFSFTACDESTTNTNGDGPGPASSSVDITMVSVPAGTFQRDLVPTNTSAVSAFQISEKEITRAQFKSIMGKDPSSSMFSSGTNDPVHYVNWFQAVAFCNKLSAAKGLTRVYDVEGLVGDEAWKNLPYDLIPRDLFYEGPWDKPSINIEANGFRLPTEMEWIWAAMGAPEDGQGDGINTKGFKKAFAGSAAGNVIDDYAWHSGNSNGKTHPVGSKLPNELGLYDMTGNVSEWGHDFYENNLPQGALINYQGAAVMNTKHVTLGSSRDYSPAASVAGTRRFLYSTGQNLDMGFRVVLP